MNIIERKREGVSVYEMGELFRHSPKELLLSAVLGRVLMEDAHGRLLGWFPLDAYEKDKDKARFEKMPMVQEDEDIPPQVASIIHNKNYYGILPVVDADGRAKKFLAVTHSAWEEDTIFALTKMAYLSEKNIDISFFFSSHNMKRIVIWGCNKMALTLSLEIQKHTDVNLLGIFDNIKNKPYNRDDMLNYPAEVSFVDSMKRLEALKPDVILICDWTMRHAGKIIDFAKVYYVPGLFKSGEFLRSMNFYNFSLLRTELSQAGVPYYSVRIPDEADLGLSVRKGESFNTEKRFQWFSKETGYPMKSQSLKEFNDARLELTQSIIKRPDGVYFQDYSSKDFNYMGGKRFIPGQTREYKRHLFLVGPCMVSGIFNKDDQTLGYVLQQLLDQKGVNCKVVAIGIPNDADRYYFHKALRREHPQKGDIAILLEQTFRNEFFDLNACQVFQKCLECFGRDFYYDIPAHMGKDVMQPLAEFLYINCLSEQRAMPSINEGMMSRVLSHDTHDSLSPLPPFSGNVELENYKAYISGQKMHRQPRVGAIVMNCNPFTLGHQYLVETASKEVDIVYVFVVEEDRSVFSFQDRMRLVEAGTRHLKNVKVLPSGKFIISAITFSEYFKKDNLKGNMVDTSLDLETFAMQICPCLDISVRFVGEEPIDPVTRQYNQQMKEILPRYGIELREIPRKKRKGEAISASLVRRYIQEGQWEFVRQMVPDTTYAFLRGQ